MWYSFKDNASIRKSASTSDWLIANKFKTSGIPSKSLDINLLGNMWGNLISQSFGKRMQIYSIQIYFSSKDSTESSHSENIETNTHFYL